MIKLRRNSNPDKWFTVHPEYIKEGDIVALLSISGYNYYTGKTIPPTIKIKRKNDSRTYTASLNCFDYVRE